MGCGSDDPAREAAKEAAMKSTTAANTQTPPVDETAAIRPEEVGKLPLSIASAKVAKGATVCLSVTASQFFDIVSMQYTMKWDPTVLTYREAKNFGLPSLTDNNFGARVADRGILAYSWFDPNVKGITKPDGSKLYDVCFEATGKSGATTTVEFADAPVLIEISNAASLFLGIDATVGRVTVE